MSILEPGEGISQLDDTPELFELVNNLEDRTSELLEACSDYLERPFDSDLSGEAKNSCDDVAIAFQKCAKSICAQEDSASSVKIISGLLLGTDTRRIEALNDLLPNLKLNPIDEEGVLADLIECQAKSDTQEEFIDVILDDFATTLHNDVRSFIKRARKDHRKHLAGRMVVEVASEPLDHDDQKGTLYAFTIEPRLKDVHDPEFIPDTFLNFSTKAATHGESWVAPGVTGSVSSEERLDVTRDHLSATFQKYLNPLGKSALDVIWVTHAEDAGEE